MSRAKAVEEVKHNEHLGDLDEFTENNWRLIHSVCQRYINIMKRNNLEYDDIFQIATLGFMKAYERFDPITYDVKFSTYCVPMMQGEIQRFLRDNSSGGLKVPRKIKELCIRIVKDDAYEESPVVLADRYETTVAKVKTALKYLRTSVVDSMDKEVYNAGKGDESVTIADQLGDEQDYTSIFVQGFLDELDERDKKIVLMVMDGSYTQREIGEVVGTSQVQVSRIIKDRLGPILKGYMDGVNLNEIDTRRKDRKKNREEEEEMSKKMGRPKQSDFSHLNKRKLSSKTTRELVLEGYKTNEIVYLKGVKQQTVYAMKKKIREEQEGITKPYDEPIVELADLVEANGLLDSGATFLEDMSAVEEKEEEEIVQKPVTIEEVYEELLKRPFEGLPELGEQIKKDAAEFAAREPDFELAKKIIEANPDADRVFVAEETGLSVKQVSDMRWRIKARGQGTPAKSEKKLEFNLHASSGKATKNEMMKELAMIMETLTALGANSLSYYISVQSPAELDKTE